MPICGPKTAICGIVLSVWGIVMLGFLGIFFRMNAPMLIEDLPIDEEVWAAQNYAPSYLSGLYKQVSVNCWIAAALYVAVLVFSFIQHRLNLRASYMMS